MKVLVALFILGIGALGSASGLAEEETSALTLEQALEEGTGQSPSVQKYRNAVEQAKWESYGGLGGLLPKVELNAHHNFATQYETVPVNLGALTASVPLVYPQTSLGALATWTVFDGLASLRQYEASLNAFEAAREDLSRSEFETRQKIELAFFNALAAQRFEEVAEENVKTLQEDIRQIRLRVRNGVATQYDQLRVEVQLSDAETELERTQDNVVIQRKLLAQAMGRTDDTRAVQGELPAPKLVSSIQNLPAPTSANLQDRQDYRASQLRSLAADQQSKAAYGALLPTIGLTAEYDRYENTGYPGEAYGGFRDAWNMGVFLKWNLFDGGTTIARAGAMRAAADRADSAYRETVLALPADYELWKRRYLYSAHRYDAKKEDLLRSQESLRIAEISFQQGRRTITDVLEAETDLFRARAGVIQSQLDAEEARLKLELTLGKEIRL